MSILDHLPHQCTAQRRNRTQGALGGGKDSWTTLWSNRSCWRQPAGDAESNYAAKRSIRITHKVYFTTDPEVDERDRLVFSDGNFDVSSASEPDATLGLGIAYRVMVSSDSGES